MAQYGLDWYPLLLDPRYGGQPRANARNAFCNSRTIHVNFVPHPQTLDQPTDARGLEGADVFGPAPAVKDAI